LFAIWQRISAQQKRGFTPSRRSKFFIGAMLWFRTPTAFSFALPSSSLLATWSARA
jgi:hypothetical protein